MISCIAIDDEPLALKQIVAYIKKVPYLALKGEFELSLDAFGYLQENHVDLLFLDINMPDLNGMDFFKSLKNPPKVIFTTAYSEYAVEGFRVNATDYLLKPIAFGDFLNACQKVKDLHSVKEEVSQEASINTKDEFLFIKAEHKLIKIKLNDIRYIEGMREYVRIHLVNQKPIMSLITMKKMEAGLPDHQFMRVHRSFIVNLDQVTTVERFRIVFDDDIRIPVSEQFKEKFQQYIDQNFL